MKTETRLMNPMRNESIDTSFCTAPSCSWFCSSQVCTVRPLSKVVGFCCLILFSICCAISFSSAVVVFGFAFTSISWTLPGIIFRGSAGSSNSFSTVSLALSFVGS